MGRTGQNILLLIGLMLGWPFRIAVSMVVALRKIRSHGHRLPAKVMELSVGVIGTMVALPLVMIARCLRPWMLIRFGTARADVIGHSIFDLTYYLSNKYLSRDESHDFFYFRKQKGLRVAFLNSYKICKGGWRRSIYAFFSWWWFEKY